MFTYKRIISSVNRLQLNEWHSNLGFLFKMHYSKAFLTLRSKNILLQTLWVGPFNKCPFYNFRALTLLPKKKPFILLIELKTTNLRMAYIYACLFQQIVLNEHFLIWKYKIKVNKEPYIEAVTALMCKIPTFPQQMVERALMKPFYNF